MSAFDDWFAKMMPDAEKWAAQFAAEPVVGRPNVMPMPEPTPEGFLVPPGLAEDLLAARKLTSYIDVPNELLMADGLIPDTRPPREPLPWRWRAKWKLRAWREQAARVAYRIIAGDWPDNGEDDW